jgi:alkylation response protein AidB-like acyl-CoA dehydrogenase
MSAPLTEAQQVLCKRAHDFADEFLEPIAADLDVSGVFPKALIGQLAKQDLLGLVVPKQAAESGAGFIAHVEVVQALSQSCAAVASIINGHALVSYAIGHWGNEAQQREHLPALAKGDKIGAIAIQEDGLVPGVGATALTAMRHGGGFMLNGTKTFVRNAGSADIYLVFATIEPAADSNGLTGFIVPAGAGGLTVGPRLATMGLKACPVAHLSFSNVAVTEADILGGVNGGSVIANQILSVGAVAEGAQTIGIAKAALRHANDYAGKRVQFHHPIGRLQAIQTMLADIATDCHLGWLGVQHAARLIDLDSPFEAEAAMVKTFLGRFGSKMLTDAIQIEGGMGISESVPKHVKLSLPLARMFRDIAGTTLLDAPDDYPEKLIAAVIA